MYEIGFNPSVRVGELFPLDGRGRLGGDVVDAAVHAAHAADDGIGDFGQEVVGQRCPGGRHAVGRVDGTQGHDVLVGALVAHDADAPDRQKHDAGLPYFVVEAVVAQALDEDVVGFLEDADFLGGDVAEDAHAQAGAGEGMAADEAVGDAEGAANAPHFVLEQQAQRLHELEVHLFGQATDVVVALDGHAGDGQGLDDVGVDGALCQPLDALELVCLAIEDVDEALADDLALALGIGDTAQCLVEVFLGVDADYVEAQAGIVLHDLAEFVEAEQAVVYEDAGESVADGAVEEHGGHGGVDAAAEGEHHLVVAELCAQVGHGALYEAVGGPGAVGAADVLHEVAEQCHAVLAVVDFGVELYAPALFASDAEGGFADVGGGADALQGLGHGGDGVAVAHPDYGAFVYAVHEGVIAVDVGEGGFAIFACVGAFDGATEGAGQVLCAVADAEQGPASAQGGEVYLRRLGVVDREGRAAEDHAYHVAGVGRELVEGVNLAVGVQLAYAPRYELRVLGAEVEYDDSLHSLFL